MKSILNVIPNNKFDFQDFATLLKEGLTVIVVCIYLNNIKQINQSRKIISVITLLQPF